MSELHKVILESLTLQSDLKGVVLSVASILQIDKRVAVERVKKLPLVVAEECSEMQARLMGDMLRGLGAGVRIEPPLHSALTEPVHDHAAPARLHGSWRTWLLLFFMALTGMAVAVVGGRMLLEHAHQTPNKSMQLLQKGKMKEAHQSLNKQLKQNPDDVELLTQKGMYFLGAARQKMEATGWMPYSKGARIPEEGEDLMNLPEADSALAALERAAVLAPHRGDVQRLISMVFQQKGLMHEAEIAARRAVETEANDVDNWNQLGVVLVELEQYGQAEQVLYEALKVDAKNPGAIKNLGILNLYHNRDTARAAAFLYRYLETDEGMRDMDRLLLRKDLARAMLGQFNPPLESLLPDTMPFSQYEPRRRRLAAIANGESNGAIQEELGILYASRQMYDAAQTCLYLAVKLDPELEQAWKVLVAIQIREGNFDQTLNTLKAAVRAGMKDPFFSRNQGVLEMYYKANPSAARKAWEHYLTLSGDSWVPRVRAELAR